MNIAMIAERLTTLASKMKHGRKPLEFFGLLLREDSNDLWDVVVAAPWLKAADRTSFEYVANKLRETFTNDQLLGLSRIVILENGGAVLRSFLERFANTVGLVDVHFSTDGGAVIRKAYVVVAQSPADQKTKKRRQMKASVPGSSRQSRKSSRSGAGT